VAVNKVNSKPNVEQHCRKRFFRFAQPQRRHCVEQQFLDFSINLSNIIFCLAAAPAFLNEHAAV